MGNQVRVTKVSGRDAEGKIYAFAVDVEHTPEAVKEIIQQVRELVPTAKSVALLLETRNEVSSVKE